VFPFLDSAIRRGFEEILCWRYHGFFASSRGATSKETLLPKENTDREKPEEVHSYEYIGIHILTRPPKFRMLIVDSISAL
jgi:hypothetical protein